MPSVPAHGPPRPSTPPVSASSYTQLSRIRWALLPRHLDLGTLERSEEAARRLDHDFGSIPSGQIASWLDDQLAVAAAWLDQPQPVAFRARLCALVARLGGLRAWSLFDMADLDGAAVWNAVALDGAREAEDHDLEAWLLGQQSLLATERGEHRSAAALLGRATATAARATPATAAWVSVLQARTLGSLGDERGYEASVGRAERLAARARPDQRHHGMDFADGALDVSYYAGLGRLHLNQPALAAELLSAGLDRLPAGRVRARAVLGLSVATAYAHDRRFDAAAATTAHALSLGSRQPVRRVWRRGCEVRDLVRRAGHHRGVGELDDRLDAMATALGAAG
jgi:hypothetical protein